MPLIIGTLTFDAAAGFTGSAVVSDNTPAVNNSEVSSYIDSVHITSDDIRAGRYYDAKIQVMLVNYTDLPTSLPSPKAPLIQAGYIGQITCIGDDSFSFEVRGLNQLLQQNIGLNTEPLCQATLFDTNCRASSTGFIFPGTHVTAVDAVGRAIKADALNNQVQDFFSYGKITFSSGYNNGLNEDIISSDADGTLHLALPMPFEVQIGDTFTAQAGCNKSIETCNIKFNNQANYFCGFPTVPGADYYQSGQGGVAASTTT